VASRLEALREKGKPCFASLVSKQLCGDLEQALGLAEYSASSAGSEDTLPLLT